MTEQKVHKDQLLQYLKEVDALLREKEQSVSLYLIGGSLLTALNIRAESKDIDLILKVKEYPLFESIQKRLKGKYSFSVDYFVDGWLPDIRLPDDFTERAREVFVGQFQNLRVYVINTLDFVISKIIANREQDIVDVERVLEREKVPKETLIQRFEQADTAFSGKGKENKEKFYAFVNHYYGGGEDHTT